MICTGTVLAGRYRIEQHIASGGMGDVWQGYDRVLGRTVAIKCLRAPAVESSFVDRFRGEARTMATISHPGVVEVYDFGDDPMFGVYLVMKHIDGESLAHVLAREERLDAEATMRLVAEAAEALHAAHEKGVTHRDVKPGNLLLHRDGGTMLTDFGIARSAEATRHTMAGSLLGTASYIAPERAGGQPATARSDIYSLGVVAYQCLAGHLPFAGDSPVQIALRHANDEPPPLPEDVPPGVREVVQRAMAKDPAARYPSGAALAAAARRAIAPARARGRLRPAVAIRVRPMVNRLGRRLLSVAAAAAVAIAIIATSVAVLSRHGDPGATDPVAGPAASSTVIADATRLGNVPAVSPAPVGSATAAVGTTGPALSSATTGPTRAATTPPAMPSNLTATPLSATTIRLQWTDNSTDENGFTVINGATSRNAGANTTTYDWVGLAPSTYTCFKVRAFNSAGVSAFAPVGQQDWACATSLPGTGPAAPTDLLAAPVNSTTIRLAWTDNSTDENGFTVINGATSRNAGANTTTYLWDGLAPNTYMCFKVRSFNASGVSAYDPAAQQDWVCATTPPPPV